MPITVDLTKNEKQAAFFTKVLEGAYGDNEFRYFFYGGAIRGGKTYVSLALLVTLCRLFPGSKWVVIRKSFATLKETTIPTMVKILGKSSRVKWNRDQSNYHVEFQNESRIFFAGENITQDPDLNWMLGLEANGFLLEQVEELSEKMFDFCVQRSGTWYIDPMPTPLILATFNPTMTWVRQKIYEPAVNGQLEAPYYFQNALPDDNPWVTEEQWRSWEHMDPQSHKRFIKGSWDFERPANVFAYSFSEKKHVVNDIAYDPSRMLKLSFDFNVEPITCLAIQDDDAGGDVRVINEFRLLNSDIFELCEHIITTYPDAYYMITGDATGQSKTAITKGNRNYYQIIRQQLRLSPVQLKVPRQNPGVKATRVLTNALFSKHPSYSISRRCRHLIQDLNNVTMDEHGDIDKGKDKHRTHLLDCLRYYNWTFLRNFLDKNLYHHLIND